jgi:hypothetical protein
MKSPSAREPPDWKSIDRRRRRALGWICLITMLFSMIALTSCLISDSCSDSRLFLAIFVLSALGAPVGAVVIAWCSRGLTRREKWRLTHSFTLGFGALESAFRYLFNQEPKRPGKS